MQWNGFALSLLLLSGFSTFNDTAFASTPVVTVTSPGDGSQDGSPVNFIASATSPDCASGIAAIRIYTAPGVGAYTVDASSLNVNLSLAAGTYNIVVQAWDNCGGVGKTPVSITVGGSGLPEPKFLYASSYSKNRIYEYNVDPNSGVIIPTTQGFVATGSEPEQIGTDKGGFRLYVAQVGAEQVSGYFINRSDGSLQAVPGSPGAIKGYPADVQVHPSGDYVYVPVHINNPNSNYVYAFKVGANGSLSPVPGSPFATYWPYPSSTSVVSVFAAAIDPTGNFLYAVAYGAPYVDAYRINKSDGSLTPVSGQPFFLTDDIHQGGASTLAFAQGGQHLVVPSWWDAQIIVYDVNPRTGALTNAPGSPLTWPHGANLFSIAIDPTDRWWYLYESYGTELPAASLATFTSKGTIEETGQQCGDIVRADPSGKFVYAIGNTTGSSSCYAPGAILGFAVNQSDGALMPLPGSPYPSPVADFAVTDDGLVVTP